MAQRKGTPRYGVRLFVNSTMPLNEAVHRAAYRQMTNANAWCRRVILEALEREGIEVEPEFEEPHRAAAG